MESELLSPGSVEVDLGEYRLIPGPKGDTGERGPRGYGIESAVLNPDYTLTLKFEDGYSYTTPVIRGADGAGIKEVRLEAGEYGGGGYSDALAVELTDGKLFKFEIYNRAAEYFEKAAQARDAAKAAQTGAEGARDEAESAAAAAAQGAVENAQRLLSGYVSDARTAAESSAGSAQQSAESAGASQLSAQESAAQAQSAGDSAEDARASKEAAVQAQTGAESARDLAQGHAGDAGESAKAAADSASQALSAQSAAQESAGTAAQYSGKPPVIDGESGNWMTWDAETGDYADTGKPSRGERGETGPQGPAGPGSGDMEKSVYDTAGLERDIFGYVDEAVENAKIVVDASPTESSENAVSSGGVYEALRNKVELEAGTYTFPDSLISTSTIAGICPGHSFPQPYLFFGSKGKMGVTKDFRNWTFSDIPQQVFNSVTVSEDKIVAGGRNGTIIYTDIDGIGDSPITWQEAKINTTSFFDNEYTLVAYGGGVFVAFFYDNAAWSEDIVTWNNIPFPELVSGGWKGVAYSGGRFVAVTGLGKTAYSDDGKTWQMGAELENTRRYTLLTYRNKFVVLGKKVAVSSDGITWDENTTGYSGVELYKGCSQGLLGGMLVAISNKEPYFSSDGITWQKSNALPDGGKTDYQDIILFNSALYAIIGRNAQVYLSEDAVNWAKDFAYILVDGQESAETVRLGLDVVNKKYVDDAIASLRGELGLS